MTTTVINIRSLPMYPAWYLSLPNGASLPENHVYIGRPSKWGNPFEIGKDGTRAEVIERFRDYATRAYPITSPQVIKAELKDKVLICWCKPLACHGDVLAELADE